MDNQRPRAPHQERRRRRGRDQRRRRHATEEGSSRRRRRDRTRSRERRRELTDGAPSDPDASAPMVMPSHENRDDQHVAAPPGAADTRADVPTSERPSDGDRPARGRGGRRGGTTKRPKLSVPDNWDDVAKMGALVASSRFVAMRVPLDDKFTRMIRSPQELWTPEMFLQAQAGEGHDVRLLIDLTNTTKYYDGQAAFDGSGVKYVKLCIEGFKAPPRESEVDAFVQIVDEFVASEPLGNIAVHCTHGLNRTGYLVVSYLVRRSGMSVQAALKAFSDARPPGLIKHMYVEDLFRRFAPNAHVELPELPAWATAKYAARRR